MAESPATPGNDPATSFGSTFADLVSEFLERRPIALARVISVVENEGPGFEDLLHELLLASPARARRIGVTGPPGAGKSTLVAALGHRCRSVGGEVGILAVDPTSPLSGGALLGDRIRMMDFAGDPGTFVRSMASRGSLGGLATTSKEVLDAMEAFGFSWLLIETMGVGQAEIDVVGAADSVVVVLVPESGDGIQAMKSGLMEVADIFVVNKRDRPGADRMVDDLRLALRMRRDGGQEQETDEEGWTPPVLLTEARSGDGMDELVVALERHQSHLARSGELERRRAARTGDRVREVLDREVRRRARTRLEGNGWLEAAVDRIRAGEATPYSVVLELLDGEGE